MGLFEQFETNQEMEVEGVWVDYGPINKDGSSPAFKIARMSKANKRYTKALNRATRPHKRSIELETLSDELADDILMNVFCESVILDWRNVQDKDGNTIPFSAGHAKGLFVQLPELYADLSAKASKAALFREVELNAEAGN